MWKKLNKMLSLMIALALPLTALAESPKPTQTDASKAARSDIEKTLGFVPRFFDDFSSVALAGTWAEMKGLQLNPGTALSGEAKELIGLAVAAQVPCQYCVIAHTEFAGLNGADAQEIAEAIAVGGIERHWSAYFYGLQNDPAAFRAEVARIVSAAKNSKQKALSPIEVVDEKTALADIQQTLGFVPEFLRRLPASALPGAWRELRDVKLSSTTRLTPKLKALIALAVASQVPSEACVMAETEFAKLAGASDKEIAEAVGMAAITRNMSTLLNGGQTDMKAFRADVGKLVAGVKAAQRAAAKSAPAPVASAKK